MRSADVALGVPFNIASYALLTHMVAKCVGMRPGKLVIIMADCHLYENHIEGAREQISREAGQFPTITFRDDVITGGDISQFTSVDQVIINRYLPHGTIKYPMAV
jgi:thymidylate synthase